jgi:hypothetical protein
VTGPEFDDDLDPSYRAGLDESDGPPPVTGWQARFTDPHRDGWLQHRKAKVRAEIERNRRGEYRVPTWVLTLSLVVLVVGLVLLFALAA